MKKKIILDILSIIPYYDYYLVNNLSEQDDTCFSFTTTFLRDKSVVNKIHNRIKCVDIIYKSVIGKTKIGKCIKIFEYLLNLIILTIMVFLHKVDVIHVQWLPLIELVNIRKLELILLKIWKSKGVNIVYTVHNILPHDTGEKFYSTYLDIYRTCNQLICHTNNTALQLENKFGIDSKKINIIPHGPLFDSIKYVDKKKAKKELGLPNTKIVLLLGFLRPYKGIEFLLEAWKAFIDNFNEPVNLIIAGDGKVQYKNSIQELIKKMNIENSVVTKFEFIKTEEVPLYHYAADLVVFPYKSIDQSGALYTAMATERPIIATDVGGFKDVINDGVNGYLVEYGNKEQLARKISNILSNDDISNKFVKENIELIEYKYNWKMIAKETLEVYKRSEI